MPTTPTSSKCDILKICVLLILWGFGFYNAATVFFYSPSAIFMKSYKDYFLKPKQFDPDLSLCAPFKGSEKYEICRTDFRNAFKNAEVKCKGYISNLRSCTTHCNVEKSNVASCLKAVTTAERNKWNSGISQSFS